MPRVSILLPVHNAERFLDAALDSMAAQTFADFELIVIDDGSSDDSPAIAEAFAARDPRTVVIRQDNRGLVPTLNRALALARGEFVARMDADDVALPERFAWQVAYLDTHPEVAVVGANIRFIDEAGRPIGDYDYPLAPDAVARALETGSPLAHPSVLMRRDIVLAAGGYRAAVQHAEDYDLWLRIAERAQLANLPERLLLYRQHDRNVTRRHAARQMLAGRFARLSAAARRDGQPDPLAGLERPASVADLDRFGLSAAEKAELLFQFMDLLIGSYSLFGDTHHLDDLEAALARFAPRHLAAAPVVQLLLAIARRMLAAGRIAAALRCGALAAARDPLLTVRRLAGIGARPLPG